MIFTGQQRLARKNKDEKSQVLVRVPSIPVGIAGRL